MLTRDELTTAARILAGQLGPVRHAPVACLVEGGASAVVAMFATWLAGGVYVPVNSRLSDPEVRAHLLATAPASVITPAGQSGRALGDFSLLMEQAPQSWRREVAGAWSGEPFPAGAALVIRTSGTTGAAKPDRFDPIDYAELVRRFGISSSSAKMPPPSTPARCADTPIQAKPARSR